jgi:hypothetical protein
MNASVPASRAVPRREVASLSLGATAVAAILRRDLVVTGREPVSFLAQAMIQPLFFLFS